MAEKQANLNGAYYGPAIPPPQQHYHRPGRGGGFGCCFCFLLKLIVSLAVIIGLAGFIFWLIFRPNRVKFYVNDATLTQFNFTSSNILQYDLALNITVRNPNKKIGIYYDTIEVKAIYKDQRFGVDYLDPFYQGHKNTTLLYPVFKSQQVVVLTGDRLTQFNQEKASGSYDIDVEFYLKIRFKVGKIKVGKFKPKVDCGLKLPVNGTSGETSGIGRKCKIDF